MDKNNKEFRASKETSFFVIIFVVWYSSEILLRVNLQYFFDISRQTLDMVIAWLVWGMLMIQILFLQKYAWRELVLVTLMTAPILVATILSGHNVMMSAWMFIVAAKNIDFESVIRIAHRVLCIVIPIIFLLYFGGVIPNYVMYRNGVLRYSFGFNHPNILGMRLFQLFVCHFYIRRNHLRVLDYLFGILLVGFTIYGPNSKTAYISIFVVLVLTMLYQLIEKKSLIVLKLYTLLLAVGYVLLNLSSILFSAIGSGKYTGLDRLDRFLSIRFSACHLDIEIFGISLLGQRVYISETERATVGISRVLYLDNAYVGILLRYGMIVYIFFSLFYLGAMIYFYRNQNYYIALILFTYGLYGVMEPAFYSLTHNIFLLSLSYYLYSRKLPDGAVESNQRFRILFRQNMIPGMIRHESR